MAGGAIMTVSKTMVEKVEEYLSLRRKLGYQLRIEGQQLLRFAKYVDELGYRGPITTDLALNWARLPKEAAPLCWARRLEVVRCFAKHRAIYEPETEIPPHGILGPAHRRPHPYIYSDKEISALLQAAMGLSPMGGLRPRTYATLFGLLACTGLRISEALRLRCKDVDLQEGVIRIVESKFQKTRLVPLHPSAVTKLGEYARFRDSCLPVNHAEPFFANERGSALPLSTVHSTFSSLRCLLGWRNPTARHLPRIHDLRHTFVCRRLLKWYEEGTDINHAILDLSTYLGHAKVTDTYWYITGIPELLSQIALRFELFAGSERGGQK
jgi:integrase